MVSLNIEELYNTDKKKKKGKQEESILNKIWKAIKTFFKMLADSINRIIDKITNRSKKNTSIKMISCDSIILKLLKKSKMNVPEDTSSWKIPEVNKSNMDSYSADDDVVTESAKQYTTVNIPAGNGSAFIPKQIKVPKNDLIAIINNDEKIITFHQAGSGKFDKTVGYTGTDDIETDVKGTKKSWTHSSRTALCLLQKPELFEKLKELTDLAIDTLSTKGRRDINRFNNQCKKITKDIASNIRKAKLDTVEVTFKTLTDFQKSINDMTYKIDKFSDIDTNIERFDKETIGMFNELYKRILDVQISMNMVSSSFNESIVINECFVGCIKNIALLDEFVNNMIQEGVPPKYIAYNTWLAADPCIKGKKNTYDPVWGQTRFIFFPPDKRFVYKIAMSGAGITSNEAEIRVSDMFIKMDRVDLIAPVIKHFNSRAIIAMERIDSDKKPSYATCLTYTNNCNNAIKKYEKDHNVHFNIKIADQHIDNVKYDENNKCYRSIDYGIATRSFNKK